MRFFPVRLTPHRLVQVPPAQIRSLGIALRTAAVAALVLAASGCREKETPDEQPADAAGADAVDRGPRRSAADDEPSPDTTGIAVPGADTLPGKTAGADTLLALLADAPSLGREDAPVVIIEFSDFECPFCARAKDTVGRLMRNRPGARLIYVQYPILSLHPGAMLPSEAAVEAQRQGKFWEYHDALFAHGPPFEKEKLLRIAADLDLDGPAMRRARERRTHRARVEREMKLGEDLGITGTPTFFINGYRLVGAQPYETFVTAYNVILRATRRELAEAATGD